MNTQIYPVDEMIRGEHFADSVIEIGPKLPLGLLRCTLERCHVKVHAFTPSIRHSRLVDCTIECTKKMTDRRLPKFFSSDYVRCKFVGRFEGVDFGRDPSPYSGKPDKFGEFIDCNFTQSTLDLCRFFGVDITKQRFAPWPQFVIPSEKFAAAAQLDYAWPGEMARFIRLAKSEHAAVTAGTGTVADFTKRYAVTALELEEALDVIGGILR